MVLPEHFAFTNKLLKCLNDFVSQTHLKHDLAQIQSIPNIVFTCLTGMSSVGKQLCLIQAVFSDESSKKGSMFLCGRQPFSCGGQNLRTAKVEYLPATVSEGIGMATPWGAGDWLVAWCSVNCVLCLQLSWAQGNLQILTSMEKMTTQKPEPSWSHFHGLNCLSHFVQFSQDFTSSDTIELILSFGFGPRSYLFAT